MARPSGWSSSAASGHHAGAAAHSGASQRLTGFFLCISLGWMVFLFLYFTGKGDEQWIASRYQQLNYAKETALLGPRLAAEHLERLMMPPEEDRTADKKEPPSELRPRAASKRDARGSLRPRVLPEELVETNREDKGEEGDQCPGGIVALTYASHRGRDDRFCRTLESAIRNDVPLRVLGWGVKWEGLAQKLKASYQAVEALPESCIVLFTDGFDVLFLDSLQAIKDRFLEMHVPLLFSGECGCWPQIQRGISVCTKDYPESPTLYRFLNSGSWMGYATQAKELLGAIISEGQRGGGSDFNKLNDQELVSDMYMAGRHNISLDHYARIFQSVHSTDAPLPDCHPENHLRARDGYWYNEYMKTKPAVFHFNGGGKAWHLPMESKVWYKAETFRQRDDPEKVLDHRLWMGDKKLRLRDVCPSDFFNIRNR